jgi:hypothetical protein
MKWDSDVHDGTKSPRVGARILGFLLFIVVVLLTALACFAFRDGFTFLLANYVGISMRLPFYQGVASVLVVLSGLVLIFIAEPYLRNGVILGQLRRRFLVLAIPLSVFIVFWYGLYFALQHF